MLYTVISVGTLALLNDHENIVDITEATCLWLLCTAMSVYFLLSFTALATVDNYQNSNRASNSRQSSLTLNCCIFLLYSVLLSRQMEPKSLVESLLLYLVISAALALWGWQISFIGTDHSWGANSYATSVRLLWVALSIIIIFHLRCHSNNRLSFSYSESVPFCLSPVPPISLPICLLLFYYLR